MRIISGELKGRRLKLPKGDRIRPTEDRIKENVFNLLFGPFEGVSVLDLFSGTGHIGIEFLSRGARNCWFCDNHTDSIRLIRENVAIVRYENKSRIFQLSFEKCLAIASKEQKAFDYIYIDPPYKHRDYYDKSVCQILKMHLLTSDARVILEAPSDYIFDDYDGLSLIRKKNYGSKSVWIYESCD